jgi:hypothetical protein
MALSPKMLALVQKIDAQRAAFATREKRWERTERAARRRKEKAQRERRKALAQARSRPAKGKGKQVSSGGSWALRARLQWRNERGT